jgi:iron(III) transport system ATP-binding protein
MNVGIVAQVGTPPEIYYQPSSRYVAEFIGSANEISGTVQGWEGPRCRVGTAAGEILGTPIEGNRPDVGDPVTVLFRPEHCRLVDGPAGGVNHLSCQVERSMFLGSHVDYVVRLEGQQLLLRSIEGEMLPAGVELTIRLDPERARVFPAS